MTDVVDMREDGEISDGIDDHETEEVYRKVERPQVSITARTAMNEPYKSESSENSDSDSGDGVRKLTRRLDKPHASSSSCDIRSKNGHLWKSMIQEETLMETMKTIDVSRKRKNDRGAESYDFPNSEAAAMKSKRWKRRRIEHSEESSSSNGSSKSFKRAKRNQNRNKRKFTESTSKILPNIQASLEGGDYEEFANELAENLEEHNFELIHRVVAVIGKEASLEIYKTTQDIERNGGMLTINRIRRRTPGGVFLFLVKESSNVDEESRKMIFSDEKRPAERKMSSEQMAKIPPNSPENSDYVENERKSTLTDPNLISQILNFTNDGNGEDIFNEHNDEMDIF